MSRVAGVAFRAPGSGFDSNDEAQFRRSVEQSIQAITQPSFKTGTPSTLSSGDNNNYDIGPISTFLRLSANASGSTITGLTDGTGERRILLLNISANTLTLEHQDTASTATNRIVTPSGFAMTLLQDDMAELIYDDVSSRWRITEDQSKQHRQTGTPSALSSGDNNNYDIGPISTFLRLSANASDSAITGLTDGIGERRILLLNISANTLTLEHQDTASSATNRIITPNGAAMTLLQNDMAELIYDAVSSRWRVTEDQSNTPNDWTTISSSAPSGTPVNGTGSLWVRTA